MKAGLKARLSPDGRQVMAGAALALLVLGLVAMWDFTPVSRVLASQHGIQDGFYLVKRQIWWFALGSVLAILVMRRPGLIFRYKLPLAFAAVVLLLLPLIPQIGDAIRGARRSFQMFGVRIHTGYWGILFSLPLLVDFITRIEEKTARYYHYGALCLLIMSVTLVLRWQPDRPLLLLFDLIAVCLLLKSRVGLKGKLAVVVMALSVPLFEFIGMDFCGLWEPRRLTVSRPFIRPPGGDGFQTAMALLDLRGGGLWGSGLGYYQTVSPHTYVTWDTISRFIVQIVGRQFGLPGLLLIVGLFGLITYYGFKHLPRINNLYQRNLATAMLLFLLLPGYLGLLRTLNLLPVLPSYVIPLMGYGGQALVAALLALGSAMADGNTRSEDLLRVNQASEGQLK